MFLVFKIFLFQLSLLIYSSKLSIYLTCLKLFLRFFLNKDVECLDENISQNNQTQNILNYENKDSNRDELVLNFKINFSEITLENDEFPSSFNCSFSAFDQEFHFYFKYRSFAFSENTPVYMWNGLILEKRIDGKVFFLIPYFLFILK
jgi:hypothetical protein